MKFKYISIEKFVQIYKNAKKKTLKTEQVGALTVQDLH